MKLVVFSAPSGSGKSTIINYLLEKGINAEFSISATSRPVRGAEQNGVEYWFLSAEEFKQRVANDEFIEYEEVYPDRFYGTLKSEVSRIAEKGKATMFDVDVKGGLNIKKMYGDEALLIFIMPPSVEELRKRLTLRGQEPEEEVEQRVAKAAAEMTFAPQFDAVIINDDLEKAKAEVLEVVNKFLKK